MAKYGMPCLAKNVACVALRRNALVVKAVFPQEWRLESMGSRRPRA